MSESKKHKTINTETVRGFEEEFKSLEKQYQQYLGNKIPGNIDILKNSHRRHWHGNVKTILEDNYQVFLNLHKNREMEFINMAEKLRKDGKDMWVPPRDVDAKIDDILCNGASGFTEDLIRKHLQKNMDDIKVKRLPCLKDEIDHYERLSMLARAVGESMKNFPGTLKLNTEKWNKILTLLKERGQCAVEKWKVEAHDVEKELEVFHLKKSQGENVLVNANGPFHQRIRLLNDGVTIEEKTIGPIFERLYASYKELRT